MNFILPPCSILIVLFQTEYLHDELKEEKIQLLEKKTNALKKYIEVTDVLWDKLINNSVLSQFEVEGFKVSYQSVIIQQQTSSQLSLAY